MTDHAEKIVALAPPMDEGLVFLNHAAVAPLSQPAAEAMYAYVDQASQRAYVGSGWYRQIAELRGSVARLIGARSPDEIAFVPNTSTGLSLVAHGIDWLEGDEVVITNVEYPANRYPWMDVKRHGVKVVEVPEGEDGRIEPEDVIEAITDRTRVVAISHVQYGSGYRVDLKPIADMVHHAGGWLCVDGIQSVGAMPLDVAAWGVDFLAADGHKWMLGPEGAGIFYCRETLLDDLRPAVIGWANMVNALDFGRYQFEFAQDARRFEPGTHNVGGLLALKASIDGLLDVGLEHVWDAIERVTSHACAGLRERGYEVFTPRDQPAERSGIVSFFPRDGEDVREVASTLEKQGIIVAARAGRLRISPHCYTRAEQIDRLLKALG